VVSWELFLFYIFVTNLRELWFLALRRLNCSLLFNSPFTCAVTLCLPRSLSDPHLSQTFFSISVIPHISISPCMTSRDLWFCFGPFHSSHVLCTYVAKCMFNSHDVHLTSSTSYDKIVYITRQAWAVRFCSMMYISPMLLRMSYHFCLEFFSPMDTNGCFGYLSLPNAASYFILLAHPHYTHTYTRTFICHMLFSCFSSWFSWITSASTIYI
jgi:hypothetical protein